MLQDLAKLADDPRFTLSDDDQNADLILIADLTPQGSGDSWWKLQSLCQYLRSHPRPEDVFVYCPLDKAWCVHQGLYPSMPRFGFDRRRQRACGYVHTHNPLIDRRRRRNVQREPHLLYAFSGARNHPCREAILNLRDDRAELIDTTGFVAGESTGSAFRRKREYASQLQSAKFAICPRGEGTSSHRLFECMALSRVPVIVSDAWVTPEGPDWNAISLRVREKDARHLPEILRKAEPQWEQMAKAARLAYDQWFAPEVRFPRMIEACLDIQSGAPAKLRRYVRGYDKQQLLYRVQGKLRNITRRFQTR